MINPFKQFNKMEWILWISSIFIIIISNIIPGSIDPLTLIAALIGVTCTIIAARGNVWSPILMIFFSIMYGIISWRFHYWGEMVTYMGMAFPMAVWSTITWIRNPSVSGEEVAIQRLNGKHYLWLTVSGTAVTIAFYFILKWFDTPNLFFSTISVTTSFIAAALTMLRSSYFALIYALNDLILIVLWVLASIEDISYLPVVVNFAIFFINDMYGFILWKIREKEHLL